MDNYQWSGQWEQICKLWPTWEPSDEEHRIWRENLESYDIFLLDKARKAYYLVGARFRRPDLGKLVQSIREEAKKSQQPTEDTMIHYVGFICTEAGQKPAGHYDMFCYVAHLGPDRQWLLPHSQFKRDLQEKFITPLGGKWILMVSESYVDIRRRAATYRPELVGPAESINSSPGTHRSPGPETEGESV